MKQETLNQLVALTSRFSGSEVEYQVSPKEAKHRVKSDVAIHFELPIKKVTIGTNKGLLGKYSNKVNGQLLIEGKQDDFVAKKASGKINLNDNIYQNEIGDKFYLGCEPTTSSKEYVFVDTKGKQLTDAQCIEYLQASEVKHLIKSEDTHSISQGTDEAVKWITPSFENITWIKINGKTIVID